MRDAAGQSRDREASQRFARRLGMALVMLAIVAGFYWKLTLTRQFEWIWGPDLTQQVLPWFEVQARAWHQGALALWDPYVWAGQPLLGQAQPGAAYPLNWILFALPLRPDGLIRGWALEWYFVVIRFMALAFCYLLCRDLGRSRIGSLVAGAVYALGGYIGNTGWPQWINGALWLPLVFLFLLRAGRDEHPWCNAVLSGTFLGIAWLSGHHQAPIFLMLAAAGAWLYFIFRSGRLDWRMARAAALAFVFTLLTGALQILPAYEYGHLARRWVGVPDPISWDQPVPYSVHETYDLKPFDLLGTVFPRVSTDVDTFVGVTGLALAVLGLAVGWRRDAHVRLLSAVGLGGLVYALGHYSVFHGFLYGAVPELDKARVAAAAIVIFQFGVAVLAAFGLDSLGHAPSQVWARRIMWSTFGFGLLALAVFQTIFFANKWSFPGQDHVMLTPFAAFSFAALVLATMRRALTHKQCAVLLLLLALFELGNNAATVVMPRSDANAMKWLDQMRGNNDIAAFLKRQQPFPRATVADNAFAENWGAMHEVEMWHGSVPSVTTNLLDLEFWKLPVRLLWGVGYTIAAKPGSEGDLVFTSASGMKVYHHKDVFPRAWAVHELVEAPDLEAGNRMIEEQVADFHRLGFTQGAAPALERCESPDDVALMEHSTDQVRIRASLGCRGMVVLSDIYFPGWRADIDGHPAPIYEVNLAMRGVIVPRGAHTLTMRYRPASYLAGGLLSLAGLAGCLAVAVHLRRVSFKPRPYAAVEI
jgi:hypothetical protein